MKKKTALLFSLVCFLYSSSRAQSYIITTIAGNTTTGYGGDGGQATAAELNIPEGIAIDASGNIYIADNGNNRIRKINNNGIITTIAGKGTAGYSGDGGPADSAQLNTPSGIAVDAIGNVYVADGHNSRIRKISTNGIITTIAGKDTSGFSGDGGPADSAQLSYPQGILFDSVGNLYIADAGNNRIRKINTTGIISTIAGTGKSIDSGDGGPATDASIRIAEIYMNRTGNLYIDDPINGRIRVINITGIISTIAGDSIQASNSGFGGDGGLADSAIFNIPWGIAADNSGNVYIADECNQRIRMIDHSTNIISTIAGSGPTGIFSGSYSGDGGPATNATLNTPWWITLDGYDNVYFTDGGNNCIRKLTPVGPASISALAQTDGAIVFPNPCNGVFNIELKVKNDQLRIMEVYNMMGEEIYNKTFGQTQGDDQINLKGQSAGVYLCRLITETGNCVATGKLIIK